jgi:hypothetical protein
MIPNVVESQIILWVNGIQENIGDRRRYLCLDCQDSEMILV